MKKGDHNGNLLKNSTTCEDGADRPGWVPSVRVVVRDGKAQSGVCLKPLRGQKLSMWEQRKIKHLTSITIPLPAIWGGHVYRGWLEGEL